MNPFPAISISLGSELAAAADALRRVTVRVRGRGAVSGSGVIWRSDGLIVTNAHVATAAQCSVESADGRVLDAKLLLRDPTHDLALLQVRANSLEAAQSRDPSSLRTGEIVLAVGNPMGLAGAFATGVLLAKPRPDDVLLWADIRLAPGNSGGPLSDARGQVVGINSMVVNGFGVAVTSGAVERFICNFRRAHGELFAEGA